MGFLMNLFRRERSQGARRKVRKTHGSLVHVFLFDSGPEPQDHARYVKSVVRSLLPETMAYADLPVSFFRDENMPSDIGNGGQKDLEKGTSYPFAWEKIALTNGSLVEGLKVGKEDYTFSCEQYSSESGNRGILFAFYEIMGKSSTEQSHRVSEK